VSRLAAERVTLGYGAGAILHDLSLAIPDGEVTAIIGPNACGKSTLLRALARLRTPDSGTVLLDGKAIGMQPTRDVARRLGLLPQTPVAPEGITVADLVARGRSPHQGAFRQWSREDEAAVDAALEATGMGAQAGRRVEDLSGGQRQRVWIAMALAQETPLLLLDEPTTYLDLRHQIEVLALVRRLNRTLGRTVVMVLHDIGLACRYADRLVLMSGGRILAEGTPAEVVTPKNLRDAYGLDARVIPDPETGTPLVIPRADPQG
jgi:iron complex transport system ATP-binding protein